MHPWSAKNGVRFTSRDYDQLGMIAAPTTPADVVAFLGAHPPVAKTAPHAPVMMHAGTRRSRVEASPVDQ